MPLPYTPEFLTSLRQRYESTEEAVPSIAADFGINEKSVYRIARREKWRMRSDPRPLPDHVRLAEVVRATAEPSTARPRPRVSPSACPRTGSSGDQDWISACAGMSGEESGGEEQESALIRLERLVLRELEIEEAQRAALGTTPRAPAEAAHKARAYATLLQTIQAIERARSGEPMPAGHSDEPADPVPHDIDEFRLALARRIDAFVAGRNDARHAEGNSVPGMVDTAR